MSKEVFLHFFQNNGRKISTWGVVVLMAVLLFLITARFIWLGKFPGGTGYDELQVALSAKTYWLFGTDISQARFPFSLFSSGTEAGLSGLPSVLLAVIFGWQKLSLFSIRFPFVLINIATLFLLSLFIFKITSNKFITACVFFVGLINPWLFVHARSVIEAPFALFFIVLGLYLLFNFRGSKILFSLIPFVLAFFSYFGFKPLLPFLIPLFLLIHSWYSKTTEKKYYFIYLLIFMFSIGGYLLLSRSLSSLNTLAYRISRESIFSDFQKYGRPVNDARRTSVTFPLTAVFVNKPVYFVKGLLQTYIGWMSPDFLFFGGDPRAMYRFGDHGMFYLLDAAFVILGIAWLFNSQNKNRNILLYVLLTLFLIAPIPSMINKNGISYFFRASLLIPAMIVLIALGISYIYENIKSRSKRIYLAVVGLLYLVSFITFLVFFFFQYPIKEFPNQYTDARILANYLSRSLAKGKQVNLVTTSAPAGYYQLLFYSNLMYQKGFVLLPFGQSYSIGSISITQDCHKFDRDLINIIDTRVNCNFSEKLNFISIQNPVDAGTEFRIYNDQLCVGAMLSQYKAKTRVGDFDIEKMSNRQFCETWITK